MEQQLDTKALAREIANEVARQLRMAMAPDTLLDSADVAVMLGCTRRFLTDILRRRPGFPPGICLGEMGTKRPDRRWRRRDVVAWINKRVESRS